MLQGTASDAINTIKGSKTPLKDLLAKHQQSLGSFAGGAFAGYIASNIAKFLALGFVKAAVFSGLGLAALVWGGLVDKRTIGLVAERAGVLDTDMAAQNLKGILDFDGDGKVDLMDFTALLGEAERLLMRSNLPATFGAIIGAALSILLWH